ncbi:MAG TPA: beta-propeller fold lactonase family protein, partial [Candidatus Angelobacter sp.]
MRALTFTVCIVLTLLTGCKDTPEPSPNYHEYAYVSNGGSNSVTVIDLRALSILTTVSVGRSPTGLAVNPRKNEIYVANTESNNISVIDAETNKVVSTIGVHRAPFFVDVSSDGKRAYVANSGSANLSVIDLDQRKVIKYIPTGNGSNLARLTP